MCGIVAYSGPKNCTDIIIDGLQKLEYRGYDSAGISYQSPNGTITTVRAVGKVKNLYEALAKNNPSSNCGIGHTRWATHGKPCQANSHPHCDCTGQISLVHNGIIENYAPLKIKLQQKGHKFTSQTDSEVIAHLIEENLKKQSFEAAFKTAISQLHGAYAIVAMYAGQPGVLYTAKQHSPLVLGVSDGEVYAGSDVPAFLKYTKKAVFLEDGDIARLTPQGFTVHNVQQGGAVKRLVTEISWDAKTAEKGGYKHFMLKEIFDQPQAIEDTLLTLPANLKKSFGLTAMQAKKIKGFYLIACGTAYHAVLSAKYFLEDYTKLPIEVETASEFKYRAINFQKDWLFIAVTQSGETADTLSALKNAKTAGLQVMSVCNVFGSTITRESDFTVYTHCGPEISVASTKAFTSQLAVLYAFALNFAYATKKITRQQFDDYYDELQTLPSLLKQTLKLQDAVQKLAQLNYQKNDFIFIGRNACFPIALEGALKLKEISYLHAEGFSGGEIKHGPIAIISDGIPVIALLPQDDLLEKMLSNCQEVAARGSKVIEISNTALAGALVLPYSNRYLFALLATIPLQFFAYYIAALNNKEIDQPRNLAKSVTVE